MNEFSPTIGFVAPEPSELAPLFPGYEIHDLIATGGMGAVYQAKQKSLDRMVAVKILPKELSGNADFRAGFEAEAKAMARLNHPNLIGVYDSGEVNGMLFIAMEYVPGKSLFHSAKGNPIDPKDVIRLVTGICCGLAHAHENGILHRDIKPSNILLTPKAEPKIGDFGLARPVERKTEQGEVIFGTPGYTAPEVLNAPEAVDCRADLFSVGVLLHELLTGKLPADDPRPASVIAGCSIRFDAIIRRATDPLPANRYSSAKEIEVELQVITNIPFVESAAKVSAGPPAEVTRPVPSDRLSRPAPSAKLTRSVPSGKLICPVPSAGLTRPGPPRRAVTVVKRKELNITWIGLLLAFCIIAYSFHHFKNIKPRQVVIGAPAAKPSLTGNEVTKVPPSENLQPQPPNSIPHDPSKAGGESETETKVTESDVTAVDGATGSLDSASQHEVTKIDFVGDWLDQGSNWLVRIKPGGAAICYHYSDRNRTKLLGQLDSSWKPGDVPGQITIYWEKNSRYYNNCTMDSSGIFFSYVNQRGEKGIYSRNSGADQKEASIENDSITTDPAEGSRPRPPGIPADAQFFNGKWYRVYEEEISWTDARGKCKILGGQLVIIPNQSTQDFLISFVGDKWLWIGATDEDKEGRWMWVDGTPAIFQMFRQGEPHSRMGEDYLAMIIDGGWVDAGNGSSVIRGFICEWSDKPSAINSSAISQVPVAGPQLNSPTAGTIVSDFEKGTEGWLGINTVNGIENLVFQNGGAHSTPKGSISVVESQGDNKYSYFAAPQKFLGNRHSADKGILRFKLKQSATSSTSDSYPFVVLKSRRHEIRYSLFQVPSANSWTEYEIPIDENKGWITETYDNVNREVMLQVLGSLESIWILAEFSGNTSDRADLDDVWLVPGSDIRRIQGLGKELPAIVGTWKYSESVQLEIRSDGYVFTNSKPNGKWTQRDKLTEYSIVLADRSMFIATLDESKSNLRIADRANGRGRSIERILDGPTRNPDVPDQIAIWRMECLKIEATIISREASIRSSSQYVSMYEKELISLRGRYQELRSKINSK